MSPIRLPQNIPLSLLQNYSHRDHDSDRDSDRDIDRDSDGDSCWAGWYWHGWCWDGWRRDGWWFGAIWVFCDVCVLEASLQP